MPAGTGVPRGRYAPPLEERLSTQRRRLFAAAARVFASVGYAEATTEAIVREAGMSKATFYEHFANKEECIVELFDDAATEVSRAMAQAVDASARGGRFRAADAPSPGAERTRRAIAAFLDIVARYPAQAETVLVVICGAGPRAMARRDATLETIVRMIDADNAEAARRGLLPRFASPDDVYAIVGAAVELVSRRLRAGHPERVRELEPVLLRLVLGMLEQAPSGVAR